MEHPDKAFYECQCSSEVLNIQRDVTIYDYKKEIYDVDIYLAMYHYGTQNHKPTLKSKLRHCWQILKTGKNFADNMVLSIEDARKLAKDLNEMCDENKIKEEVDKMISEMISKKKGVSHE